MNLTMHWLEAQKDTPTFLQSLHNNMQSILHAPLPESLRSSTPTTALNSYAVNITASRRANVHDDLLSKGMVYQEHREAMQHAAAKAELTTLKAAAVVSLSKKNQIVSRLHHRQKQSEAKQEVAQRRKAKQEEASLPTFKPSISAIGKRAIPKVKDEEFLEKWGRRHEQKLDALRAENLIREISELREGPEINPRSRRIADQRIEREGLSSLNHVDAMLERDRLLKIAKWEKGQRQLEEVANPKITVYAASLERQANVSERLYANAFDAEERRSRKMRELVAGEGIRSPAISRFAAMQTNDSRSGSVADDLLQKHAERMELQQQKRLVADSLERQLHRPVIDPVSDTIAGMLPTSSMQRLTQPIVSHRFIDPHRSEDQRSTTRSTSAATSGQLSEREKERLETLFSFEERRQENLRRLREEQQSRLLQGCTFTPKTNTSFQPQGSLLERGAQWELKKQLKLDDQRRDMEISEVQHCTFQPKLDDFDNLPTQGQALYGTHGVPWGVQEFLHRQDAARNLQAEKESRVRGGSAWTPTQTKAKAPKLGPTARSPAIRSLQPPARAHASHDVLSPDNERFRDTSLPSPGRFSNAIIPPSLW